MPVELRKSPQFAIDDIGLLALAVKQAGPFVHIGLIYRDETAAIKVSHLAFHHHFHGRDNLDPSYCWIEPQFDEIVIEQIAVFLDYVASKNAAGEIPYSILYRGKSFDSDGKYVATGVGEGLTCATYVLDVFQSLQVPIINFSTWPSGREGDDAWAATILQMLAEGDPPASAEHRQVQAASLPGVVRYRPEEVAAAFGMFTDTPLTFEHVLPESLQLLAALR